MDRVCVSSPRREAPAIPPRHHFHTPHRNPRDGHARGSRHRSSPPEKHPGIPPASPEIISNLITSLSVISQPANSHFESQPAALTTFSLPSPASPSGSFGVDYGAYGRSEHQDGTLSAIYLDDLAASPPIIRTSKPTSGYSPLTGAKSPKAQSPRRNSAGSGFRNFLLRSSGSLASCPSSPGSVTSKNDDAHTVCVGNLSTKPATAGPGAEPSRHRSHDSWAKKTGRSSKSLMYMSSKEQLRGLEIERKRLSGRDGSGRTDEPPLGGRPSSRRDSNDHGDHLDPVLAETAISEEPGSCYGDAPGDDGGKDLPYGSTQPIPARKSSLRKSRTRQKRPGDRRTKRDGKIAVGDAILEAEEQARSGRDAHTAAAAQPQHRQTGTETGNTAATRAPGKPPIPGPAEFHHAPPVSAWKATKPPVHDTAITAVPTVPYRDEGAAPFPAAAHRRRGGDKDGAADGSNGTPSQHLSPGPRGVPGGDKRNGSGLKRFSGQLTPRSESRASTNASPDPARSQNLYPAGYERPASADSIDDAIETYLLSPRLSQKIRHPQTGRVISFSEVGDPAGSAVFCCVGMGLTRYIMGFYDELASTLKLRLITPDRPGVGGSEPYADSATTPLSWPDDVYSICHALKITKFSILAHSAGAIYALATALRMPQHIRGRIHLLAPWIPPSQMNVFGGSQMLPPTNAIPTSQKILRHLPTTLLKAANSSFMTATSSSITSSLPRNSRRAKRKLNANGNAKDGPNSESPNLALTHGNGQNEQDRRGRDGGGHHQSDRDRDRDSDSEPAPSKAGAGAGTPGDPALQPVGTSTTTTTTNGHHALADSTTGGLGGGGGTAERERQRTYDTRLTHAIWTLATTGANPAVDLLTCLERRHTIGFRYVDITRPVVIHHGSRDTRVPVENVKWLGKTMRRCEVRVLEGEGHGLMASATVMGSVLMEMSKEWEDWMRVTGADGRKERERERERGRRGTIGRVV